MLTPRQSLESTMAQELSVGGGKKVKENRVEVLSVSNIGEKIHFQWS